MNTVSKNTLNATIRMANVNMSHPYTGDIYADAISQWQSAHRRVLYTEMTKITETHLSIFVYRLFRTHRD